MYGDKETFWIGFEIVRERYGFNELSPGSLSEKIEKSGDNFKLCSIQLLHLNDFKKPSWINGGLFKNKNLDDFSIILPKYWTTEPGLWDFSVGHMACLCSSDETRMKPLSPSIQKIFSKTSKIVSSLELILEKATQGCEHTVFDFQDKNDQERFDHLARSISDYDALKYNREIKQNVHNFKDNAAFEREARGIIFFLPRGITIAREKIEAIIKNIRSRSSPVSFELWYFLFQRHIKIIGVLNQRQ